MPQQPSAVDALGNIGDFVGGIGVIVTLAYLAVQIRHNTRVARAATLQQWVTMTATVNMPLSHTQFNTYCLQVFSAVDHAFFGSKAQPMRATLAPPGIRSWWDGIGSQYFDGRFQQFVARELLR